MSSSSFGEITEKSIVKTTVKTVVRVILFTVAAASAVAAWHYTLKAQGDEIIEVKGELVDHDARLKKIEAQESDIAVMKEDLVWIRNEMEGRDKAPYVGRPGSGRAGQ